ncbi:HCP-like protein [Backusella circina FSU 941]|nr:HCP-like protein [Backusella circina FSU 941]
MTNNNNDQYLQLGMQYHEKGELEKATHYWRLSAEKESPLGLFFYGIALRHGWGCRKNPAIAVRHLQKAAECAVFDLQTGIARSVSVAKSELVLAIYELGVCFRHGWGVPKSLPTAAYYFEVAANLGDPDAMNDLAFCYLHGHGVKKDLFKAAKFYRMADKKGQGLVGNSWIWKEKYNDEEEKNDEK